VWSEAKPQSTNDLVCILESKTAALVAAVFVDFLRANVIFFNKTSLISYGGCNFSQGGALGVFLLGQSPPLPYTSRRLCSEVQEQIRRRLTLTENQGARSTNHALLAQVTSQNRLTRRQPKNASRGTVNFPAEYVLKVVRLGGEPRNWQRPCSSSSSSSNSSSDEGSISVVTTTAVETQR